MVLLQTFVAPSARLVMPVAFRTLVTTVSFFTRISTDHSSDTIPVECCIDSYFPGASDNSSNHTTISKLGIAGCCRGRGSPIEA